MSFFAGILVCLLILNCLALILLVLMQLPKKDAGAGVAFGGAAADALFGAGSGNFLTQTTKYATIALFVLALILGYVEDRLYTRRSGSEFEKAVQQKQMQVPMDVPQPAASAPSRPTGVLTNRLLTLPVPPTAGSNAPVAPAPAK